MMMIKRGFKVTSSNRDKKVGVAASTLNELLQKGCDKLAIEEKWQSCKCYVATDGTLVDDNDYFETLSPQTVLIILKPDESMKTDFEFMYDMIKSTKSDYLKAGSCAQEFFQKNTEEKFKKLHEYINYGESDTIRISTIDKDPQWFEGIDTNDTTKESYMSRKAKDRMKGYFYKIKNLLVSSKTYVNSGNGSNKLEIDALLQRMHNLLSKNKFNCDYFNRGVEEDRRICDKTGKFECGGLWNEETCKYRINHSINPYRSREERILFQTWNLDHRIELSRSIALSILNAIENISDSLIKCYNCDKRANKKKISSVWYYRQIFTLENLKLVHIVCHDKAKHSFTSDEYLLCENCFKKEGNLV